MQTRAVIIISILLLSCVILFLYFTFWDSSTDTPVCPSNRVAVKVCDTPIQCRQKCGLLGYDCDKKLPNGIIECNVCNKGRTRLSDGQCCDSKKIHMEKGGTPICCASELCGGVCCGPTKSCDKKTNTCKEFCGSDDNLCVFGEICVRTEKLSPSDIQALVKVGAESPNAKISNDGNGIVHFCLKKGRVDFDEPNYMPESRPSNHSGDKTADSQNVYPCFLFDAGISKDSEVGFCSSDNVNQETACFEHGSSRECTRTAGCKWKDIPTELASMRDITGTIDALSKKYEDGSNENTQYGRYCLNDKNEQRLARFVVEKSSQPINDTNRLDGYKSCIESMEHKHGIQSVSFNEGPDNMGYCIGTVNCKETLPVCNADGTGVCPIDNIYTEKQVINGENRYPHLSCKNQQLVQTPDICISDEDPCMTRIGPDNVVEPGRCVSLPNGQFQCTEIPWFEWPFPGRSDCKSYSNDRDPNSYNGGNHPHYTLQSMRDQIKKTNGAHVNTAGSPDNVTNRSLFNKGGTRLWADGTQTFYNHDARDCHIPNGGECYNTKRQWSKRISEGFMGTTHRQYGCESCFNAKEISNQEAERRCMDQQNTASMGRETERNQ
jgi:hypothetical protein